MTRPARIALTALRIAIGWHFLYEGLWKVDSDCGVNSYATSWYTLQSSVASLRNDTQAMPLEPALARTDVWYDDLVKTFKGRNTALADDQKARLADLRDKVKLAVAGRGEEPVNFDWAYVRDEVLRVAAQQSGERFTSLPFLQESAGPFRRVFRGLVRDIDGFDRLTLASAHAAIDERYAAILKHYASAGHPFTGEQQRRLAVIRDTLKREIAITMDGAAFQAQLADYRLMRARVAEDPARTTAPFSAERLAADRTKLDGIAAELLGIANEPLVEMAVQAQTIATADQLSAGPVPRPGDPTGWIDFLIKYGLIAIGSCLMLGLVTPVAACAAAAQLAVFYLASPPWPNLPAAAMGGHYLFVDRNLIEMVAALAVATTGWNKWCRRRLPAHVEESHDLERATTASR
jgi:uncharacterized membrane protein YphA (DoxX/SURF4 family)